MFALAVLPTKKSERFWGKNGCTWYPSAQDEAAEKHGYTDDFGNMEWGQKAVYM